MLFVSLLPLVEESSLVSGATSPDGGSTLSMLMTTVGPIAVVFVVFYFFLMRPQRNKEKKTAQMRQNVQVGDDVTTIGGIVGRIVSIKDDTMVIETGADRSKVRIKKWAIQSCDTIHEDKV